MAVALMCYRGNLMNAISSKMSLQNNLLNSCGVLCLFLLFLLISEKEAIKMAVVEMSYVR